MGYRLAAWPRAFKFIGDSHGARFDGLVFLDEGDPPRYVITQAHNHYGFRSTEFSYDDGTLNARLVSSLLTLNILRGTRENAIPALGRFRTARDPLGWEFGLRLRQSYRNELLVISCGEVDARDIIRRLPLDARIAMSRPMPVFPDDPPAGTETITEAELAEEIESEYLTPLFRGMRTLVDIGIANLFLLALPPPDSTTPIMPSTAVSCRVATCVTPSTSRSTRSSRNSATRKRRLHRQPGPTSPHPTAPSSPLRHRQRPPKPRRRPSDRRRTGTTYC